ncbi:ribonuclease HII [Methanopyrus sp. KOL6]|uniref:ribonuclease HII n=1 Tax=Methanopyrus sp. KOL6 TaxID=1937004 RepID=UPI000B4B658A|nr:ribonuclease HII [Methanopyrus sp. KOL6]
MSGVMGIDEAGRGPVFGPMVVAGVLAPERELGLGARDSKELTRSARRRLIRALMSDERLRVDLRIVWPWEIDEEGVVKAEFEAIGELVRRAMPDEVILDKPGNYSSERLRRELDLPEEINLIAEERADAKYEVVSAASIVAKTYRDWIVRLLELEYGEVGSGYPSDPRTVDRLRRELRRGGELLKYFRRSWETYKRVESEVKQRKLEDFF